MKKLSLIIVTYNSEKDIYDCLESVFFHNDIDDMLEVIVVDNASANFVDMKLKINNLYGDRVKVIYNGKNGGYGQGNNLGVKNSSAPFIAIMNPDVRLIVPVFSDMIQQLEKQDVIMCAGKMMSSVDQAETSFWCTPLLRPYRRYFEQLIAFKLDKYFYRDMWLTGAFFAINKDVFVKAGSFDENIFMYAEEIDLHCRLRKMFPNGKMIYLKNKPYIHLMGDRVFSVKEKKAQYLSTIYIFKKNKLSENQFVKREIRYNNLARRVLHLLCLVHGKKFQSDCDKCNDVLINL